MTHPSAEASGVRPGAGDASGTSSRPVELPGARPAAVSGAAALMVTMTVVVTGSAAAMMYTFASLGDRTTSAADAEAYRWFQMAVIVIGVAYLLVGLVVIGLTIGVLRGRGWARVTTFCVYAVFMMCAVLGELLVLVVSGSSESMQGSFNSGDIMYSATGSLVMGSQLLAMIVTVVLLALPASNRWFKAYARAREAGLM